MVQMRPSRVLARLRAGEVACSVKLNLSEPRVAEMAAMCGIDCVWLCHEHVPSTLSALENQVRAAKAYDADTCVRVARGGYSDLIWPLEMDAAGIMVPHVMSVEDARQVIWYSRFHPQGRRPIDGGNADGGYTLIDVDTYCRTANEQRFVILQIEDPEPLDQLDEIAQLEGFDILFFGAADFAHGIGRPGQYDHPDVLAARRRVAEVCQKHGKFAGCMSSPKNVHELIDMGYRYLNMGGDVVPLMKWFTQVAQTFEEVNKR